MIAEPEQKLWSISSLHGERITLRRFRESDASAVYTYGSDPDTVRHLIWPGAETYDAALQAVREVLMQAPGVFAITFSDDVCIGCIDIRLQAVHEKAEFGYVLNRLYWGRGIMTEALGLLLKMGFENLELERIESHHFSENMASGKVMMKCGMRREGMARREFKIKGTFVDVIHYGIVREEWLCRNER